jgi:hypothetical protein
MKIEALSDCYHKCEQAKLTQLNAVYGSESVLEQAILSYAGSSRIVERSLQLQLQSNSVSFF